MGRQIPNLLLYIEDIRKELVNSSRDTSVRSATPDSDGYDFTAEKNLCKMESLMTAGQW